ncbi:MAG: hypothetical protein WC222_06815 [Parachlamydiales bacterium]|jgi:hypothetical protein
MASPTIVSGNSISPVAPISDANPSTRVEVNNNVTLENRKSFFPKETPADCRIAEAKENRILNSKRRLNENYCKTKFPSSEFLREFRANILLSLAIQFMVEGKAKTFRDFLNDQYHQSVKEGNPIVYHIYIGSSTFSYGGKTFYEKFLQEGKLPSLLDPQGRQNLETKPNDLDVRAQTRHRVNQDQVQAHITLANTYLQTTLNNNPSRFDPNVVLKIEGGKYPKSDSSIPIEYGYGNFKDFCLTDRTSVQVGLNAEALSKGQIELVLLCSHDAPLKAYVDQSLGLIDVMDEQEADKKNYIAVITMVSEIVRGKKCYHRSLYQSWIRNHALHFEDKWGLWPSKIAGNINNSLKGHLNQNTETRLIFFLQYESLLENASPEVKVNFSKGLIDSAWMNLMITAPSSDHWLYCARKKGLPASIISTFIQCGVGLVWGSHADSKVMNEGYSYQLSCLFDDAPHIQLETPQGLHWMLSWSLDVPSNIQETLLPFVNSSKDEIIAIIRNTCCPSLEDNFEITLLKKYADQLPSVDPSSVERAEALLKSNEPLLQFVGFSLIIQMHAIGVKGLEDLIFSNAIPSLLSCDNETLRTLTLKAATHLLLSGTPTHLHTLVKIELQECYTLAKWLRALAATKVLKFVTIAKNRWKDVPSLSNDLNTRFILDLMVYFPAEGLDCLDAYRKGEGLIDNDLKTELKAKLKTFTQNIPLFLSHWVVISDNCEDLFIDLEVTPEDFKDKILLYYSAFYREYKKAKDTNNQYALRQEIHALGAFLIDICEKLPWQRVCQIAAQILSSRIFTGMEADLASVWKSFFILLEKNLPNKPVNKLVLSSISALAIRWLNFTNFQKNEEKHLRSFLVFVLEQLHAHIKGSEREYRLLKVCIGHSLFKDIQVNDIQEKNCLISPLVAFFEAPACLNFPIIPLLEEAIKNKIAFIPSLSPAARLRLISHLLSEGSLEAINGVKEILQNNGNGLSHLQEWHHLSYALTLAARRHSDQQLHLTHAQMAAYTLKNGLLLEAVEIEIAKGLPEAYKSLLELCSKYKELSSDQKNFLTSCMHLFFNKPQYIAQATEWCLSCALQPPIEAEPWFECIHNLVIQNPKPIIDTISTLLKSLLLNKNPTLTPLIASKATRLILKNSSSLSWTLLELIYPFAVPEIKDLWQGCAEKALQDIISVGKPFEAVSLFTSKYFDCKDLVLIEKAFRFIFEDGQLVPTKLNSTLLKYKAQISSDLWEYIWIKVAPTAKTQLAKDVYSVWKGTGLPCNEFVFQGIIQCGLEDSLTYLNNLDQCKTFLRALKIPPSLISKIFIFLTKKKCEESLLLDWLKLCDSLETTEAIKTNIYTKAIQYALTRNYYSLLEVCITHTSALLKGGQIPPAILKKHIDPYLSHDWPTSPGVYNATQLLLFLRYLLDNRSFTPNPKHNTLHWLFHVDLGEETPINKLKLGRMSALFEVALAFEHIADKAIHPLLEVISKASEEPFSHPQLVLVLVKLGIQKLDPQREKKRKELLQKVLLHHILIDTSSLSKDNQRRINLQNLKLFTNHSEFLLQQNTLINIFAALTSVLKVHKDIANYNFYFNEILTLLNRQSDKKQATINKVLLCNILVRTFRMEKEVVSPHLESVEKVLFPLLKDTPFNIYDTFCDDIITLLDHIFFSLYATSSETFIEYNVSCKRILAVAKEKGFAFTPEYLEIVYFFLQEEIPQKKSLEDHIPIFWRVFDHLLESKPAVFEHSIVSLINYCFKKPSLGKNKIGILIHALSLLRAKIDKLEFPYQFYYNFSCFLDNAVKGEALHIQDRMQLLQAYYFFFSKCKNSLENPSHLIEDGHVSLAQGCISYLSSLKDALMFSPTDYYSYLPHTNIIIMSTKYNDFLRVLSKCLIAICKKCSHLNADTSVENDIRKEILLQVIDLTMNHPCLGGNDPEIIQFLVEFAVDIHASLSKKLSVAVLQWYLAKLSKDQFDQIIWKIIKHLPSNMYDTFYFTLLTYEGKPLKVMREVYDKAKTFFNETTKEAAFRGFEYSFLYISLCEIYAECPILLESENALADLNHTLGAVFAYLYKQGDTVFQHALENNSDKTSQTSLYALVFRFLHFLKIQCISISHPDITPLYLNLTSEVLKKPQESAEFALGCDLIHFAKGADFFNDAASNMAKRQWIYRIYSELQTFLQNNEHSFEWTFSYLLENIPQNTNNCIYIQSFENMLNKGFFNEFEEYFSKVKSFPLEHAYSLYCFAGQSACHFKKIDRALKYLQILKTFENQDQRVVFLTQMILKLLLSSESTYPLSLENINLIFDLLTARSAPFPEMAEDILQLLLLYRKNVSSLLTIFTRKFLDLPQEQQQITLLQKLFHFCSTCPISLPQTSKAFKVVVRTLYDTSEQSEAPGYQKYLLRNLSQQPNFWENCALLPSTHYLHIIRQLSNTAFHLPTPTHEVLEIFSSLLKPSEKHDFALHALLHFTKNYIDFSKHARELMMLRGWIIEFTQECRKINLAIIETVHEAQYFDEITHCLIESSKQNYSPKELKLLKTVFEKHLYQLFKANLSPVALILGMTDCSIGMNLLLASAALLKMNDPLLTPLGIEYFERAFGESPPVDDAITKDVLFPAIVALIACKTVVSEKLLSYLKVASNNKLLNKNQLEALHYLLVQREFSSAANRATKIQFYLKLYSQLPLEKQPELFIQAIQFTHLLSDNEEAKKLIESLEGIASNEKITHRNHPSLQDVCKPGSLTKVYWNRNRKAAIQLGLLEAALATSEESPSRFLQIAYKHLKDTYVIFRADPCIFPYALIHVLMNYAAISDPDRFLNHVELLKGYLECISDTHLKHVPIIKCICTFIICKGRLVFLKENVQEKMMQQQMNLNKSALKYLWKFFGKDLSWQHLIIQGNLLYSFENEVFSNDPHALMYLFEKYFNAYLKRIETTTISSEECLTSLNNAFLESPLNFKKMKSGACIKILVKILSKWHTFGNSEPFATRTKDQRFKPLKCILGVTLGAITQGVYDDEEGYDRLYSHLSLAIRFATELLSYPEITDAQNKLTSHLGRVTGFLCYDIDSVPAWSRVQENRLTQAKLLTKWLLDLYDKKGVYAQFVYKLLTTNSTILEILKKNKYEFSLIQNHITIFMYHRGNSTHINNFMIVNQSAAVVGHIIEQNKK